MKVPWFFYGLAFWVVLFLVLALAIMAALMKGVTNGLAASIAMMAYLLIGASWAFIPLRHAKDDVSEDWILGPAVVIVSAIAWPASIWRISKWHWKR